MPGSPHPNAAPRFRHGSPHPSAIPDGSGPDVEEEEATAAAPEAARIEKIPDLISMAPATFVPAKFDYTQPPPDLPPESISRANQQIRALDAHTAAVKSNIQFLIEQQARRIHLDAIKAEEAHLAAGLPSPRSKRPSPSAADELTMLRNLEAPVLSGRSLGVPMSFGYADVPPKAVKPQDTPREVATTRMLNLMRYGMQNLEGYQNHIVSVRNARMDQIKKDVAEETAMRLPEADRMDIG